MAAIYSNGGNRWNILGFNFTKRDALSSVYIEDIYGLNKLFSLVMGQQKVLQFFCNASPDYMASIDDRLI